MLPRVGKLVAVLSLLVAAGDRLVAAGGIHIRYGPDAPEKLAASNLIYYEGVLNLEHHHPIAFALKHPFYTKMFDDPAMLGALATRWEAHEQRFEYWHDCLWKVLDGYLASKHGLSPTIPITAGSAVSDVGGERGGIEGIGPIGDDLGIPDGGSVASIAGLVGSSGNEPGADRDGSGGGSEVGILSVPEPSSGMLMFLGLAVAACCVLARHHRAA